MYHTISSLAFYLFSRPSQIHWITLYRYLPSASYATRYPAIIELVLIDLFVFFPSLHARRHPSAARARLLPSDAVFSPAMPMYFTRRPRDRKLWRDSRALRRPGGCRRRHSSGGCEEASATPSQLAAILVRSWLPCSFEAEMAAFLGRSRWLPSSFAAAATALIRTSTTHSYTPPSPGRW